MRNHLTEYTMLREYGITREQYEQMYQSQKGLCLICREDALLQIDHDHETGKVRGLLCINCNHGLGNFKDSVRLLAQAIVYLEDSGTRDHIIDLV